MQPLLDAPPPVHPYAPGSWGPRRPTSWSPATAAGTSPGSRHDRHRPTTEAAAERSRAVAVPADRRLRVPLQLPHRRADRARTARSTGCASRASTRRASFGSLLDREAGIFRFGPFGINHPTARIYEPGTNVLVTTWKTPSGWIVVRDALTMGPRDHEDASRRTPGRRPTTTPTHARADRRLPRGPGRGGAGLRAGVRLRPDAGRVDARRRRPPRGRRAAARVRRSGCVSDLALGIEGNRVRAPARARSRATRAYCALSWAEELAAPADATTPSARIAATVRFWRNWLARGAHPRPPLARPDPALGARDQGPDLHADRRHRRRADHLAARDARRRAQLGLPLHLDARHHVHAAGAALAQPRLGGRRVHAVRRRPRAERGRLAADHVRHRRPRAT